MSQDQQIKVRSLKIGEPLATDLTDDAGVLLLRAGVVITQGFIDTLTRRGIDTVAQRETEEARHEREAAETEAAANQAQAQATMPKKTSKTRPSVNTPARSMSAGPSDPDGDLPYRGNALRQRLSLGELNAMTVRAERAFDTSLSRYAEIGPQLASGHLTDLGLAAELIDGFNRFVQADPTLVLSLIRMKGESAGSLYRHGLKSALLTMTLAQQMGFRESQAADGGVAALVHDLGMLRVPAEVRNARRQLTPAETLQIQQHPTHTLNMLDRITGVDDSVKTAAYQVHERCDASGYPKHRPKQFIHPLAKIIAVSDTYAALTADRPYRPALTGHEAMKTILREVQAGKHDRSVARALLDTMSLFPVGTLVGLSDGRTARVLRGVPGHSTKPVVVVIKNGRPADWELDLAEV
ncbi:MAG: HD domain-containing phosphohydrolase, partial [Planctomycetota bacterium]